MTVRREPSERNLPSLAGDQTHPIPPDERGPLLTQRAAVIFITALVIGATAGVLGYLAGARLAEAVLTGGGAFGATVALLNNLIGS
jgi:hypothetical protein